MREYYSIKLEEKLIIAIFDKYIETNGKQSSSLNGFQLSSFDQSLFISIPEITCGLDYDRQKSDLRYFKSLEYKNFISKNGHPSPYHFYLTERGYNEAIRLKNPIRNFLIEHWKFFTGMSIVD